MKNDITVSVRISEEAKEKLQAEADLSNVTISDILRKEIEDRIKSPAYVSTSVIKKQGIELSRESCPFCGVVVDWGRVKIRQPFFGGEDGKYCPSCEELVYTHGQGKGWQKRNPESEEED